MMGHKIEIRTSFLLCFVGLHAGFHMMLYRLGSWDALVSYLVHAGTVKTVQNTGIVEECRHA